MGKVLKIEKISEDQDTVLFHIIKQSHRVGEFSDAFGSSDEFKCPLSGLTLISCSIPAWYSGDEDIFYVRGSMVSYDGEPVRAARVDYERILIAVESYNKFHNKAVLEIGDMDDLFVMK